jgi:hypothetical protein
VRDHFRDSALLIMVMALLDTLFSFLKEQLRFHWEADILIDDKQERVYNFVHVPFQLEKASIESLEECD